jgi:hypothetical protein
MMAPNVAAILVLAVNIVIGFASQYGFGVFERVIRVRQAGRTAYDLPDQLPVTDGYAASQECSQIGNVWWVRTSPGGKWYSILVADCASKSDARVYDGLSGWQWMTRHNVLVELNPELVLEMGGSIGRMMDVEVFYGKEETGPRKAVSSPYEWGYSER